MPADVPSRVSVLALDTSTPLLTAAVWHDGETFERHTEAGRHTGALIPAVVAGVMAEARCQPDQLQTIAVGAGPGPYTSLRAGLMFAQAVGAAVRRPVVGACSLDITARGFFAAAGAGSRDAAAGAGSRDAAAGVGSREAAAGVGSREAAAGAEREFVVIADARRREVYWARYDSRGERLSGPQVTPRAQVLTEADARGWELIETAPSAAALVQWVTEALVAGQGSLPPLAMVGDDWADAGSDGTQVTVPQTLLTAAPLYLRRPDAVEPGVAANAGRGNP